MCDRWRSLRDIARQTDIRFGSIQSILTDILGMSKISAKWVPRMLTKDQKKNRLDISKYLLSLYEDDTEEFMPRVVTKDETLILRPKGRVFIGNTPGLFPPKKFKRVSSAGKVMVSIFLGDSHGVVMVDYHWWINTDSSFTMAYSNSICSPYKILSTSQENKCLGSFSYWCVYSLESPHRGDSNEYTQHTIIVQKIEKISLDYRHLLPYLAPSVTLSGSNYPCLEQISMAPNMFEPLKFDCIMHKNYGDCLRRLYRKEEEIWLEMFCSCKIMHQPTPFKLLWLLRLNAASRSTLILRISQSSPLRLLSVFKSEN